MAKDIKYPLPNLFKLPFPNVLSFLINPSMIGDQDLDYFEKKEDEPKGITTLDTKEKQNQPTPEPPQNQQTPPSGIDEALNLIEEKKEKKSKFTLPEKSVNDFFEVAGQYETIDGSIEDYEYAYHGGVGDLGNNRAAISIQQTEAYPDYRMWVEEQAQNFLGDEFTGFRIANTKEVMSLLNNQKKNKIKSYTLNPRQAIGFGYMANEAFMDPITTYPRGDLVIIESPIKSESLVMRGRPEESEVVTDTTGVSIKNSRIYNPYTGEVIYEPTKGPLVDKEPYQFERLLKTETKKSSFLDELKDKFTKKEKSGSLMDKPLYDD